MKKKKITVLWLIVWLLPFKIEFKRLERLSFVIYTTDNLMHLRYFLTPQLHLVAA